MTKYSKAPELQEYLRTKFAVGAGAYSSSPVWGGGPSPTAGHVSSGPAPSAPSDPKNSYADNWDMLYGRNGSLNPLSYFRNNEIGKGFANGLRPENNPVVRAGANVVGAGANTIDGAAKLVDRATDPNDGVSGIVNDVTSNPIVAGFGEGLKPENNPVVRTGANVVGGAAKLVDRATDQNDGLAGMASDVKDTVAGAAGKAYDKAMASGFSPKDNSVTWYLDKITDPNVGLYKGTVDAFRRGGDNMQQFAQDVVAPEGGAQPSAIPTAAIKDAPKATGAKTEQTGMFPMSDPAVYGLGGAGAGALLGAAMGRKGKRGRNALLGAGIGGGAGLLAQYLMNQNKPKTAAYNKSANGMLHDALGGGTGGAVLGGLYGAMTAPKKKLLRSALRGMIMGGGAGASFGLGTSAFGDPASATSNDPHAAEHAGYVRGLGAAAAGGMGGALSQRLADEYLPLEPEEDEKRSKKKLEKTALDPVGALKNVGTGAWDATKNMYGKVHGLIPVTALEGAGLGGVGLATAAGTYGLINPGEYTTQDETGKTVKKRRSRFMGSMYYSTIGKILGTIAGGVAGHMHPEGVHAINQQLMNYGSGAYDSLRKAVGAGGKPQANAQSPGFDYGMQLPNPTA